MHLLRHLNASGCFVVVFTSQLNTERNIFSILHTRLFSKSLSHAVTLVIKSSVQYVTAYLFSFVFVSICLLLHGSRDGAVVRALASHRSVPGSFPGPGVIWGLSLLLVLALAPRVFLQLLRFSSSSKINIPKFQFDRELQCHGFVSLTRLLSITLVKQSRFIYLARTCLRCQFRTLP